MWADRDGYFEIAVRTEQMEAGNEAAGDDEADYITVPCKTVQLKYGFGSQVAFEHEAPIAAHPGDILGENGVVSKNDRSSLPH